MQGLTKWAALAALAVVTRVGAAEPAKTPDVSIVGSRIHLSDLISGLPEDVGKDDVGPSPAFAGTRVVTRSEVLALLLEHGVTSPPSLPDAYRVHRKLRALTSNEVTDLVTGDLRAKLPVGVSLGEVRAGRLTRVPDGYTAVRCEVPRPPHRVGRVASVATVAFLSGSDVLWTMTVPVDLLLSEAALPYDVPHGSHVFVLVRRGLVELRSEGTVTVDADIGTVTPVLVQASGRSFRARLEDAQTAVMVEP
jgi:hypothetical protein